MRSGTVWTALALAPLLMAATAAPPAGGTIAIVLKTAGSAGVTSAFADAASRAFTARGFTILDDPDHAASVAELTVGQAAVGTGLGKDPHHASIAPIGTGVSIPFSTGASSEFTLQRTSLEIRIHRRGETNAVWDGTAVTVRAAGSNAMVAAVLSRALLGEYPAQPKEVLGVP